MEALGGQGVWERELVVVSFAHTTVTNEDLALFHDFPYIQVLDLSHTAIGDNGLVHLAALPALEELIVVDAKFSEVGLKSFQREHPMLRVVTEAPAKESRNPFTGKPF
jgi:hypothetical protein